jgi:hypothetical protein
MQLRKPESDACISRVLRYACEPRAVRAAATLNFRIPVFADNKI